MKRTTIKCVILAISISILNSGMLYAQKKADIILKKADIAYQQAKFAVAADYYESYLGDTLNSPKVVLPKLADCYWQMREYDNALRVYKLIYSNGNESASSQDKIRVAESFARKSQYQQASEWLNGVEGFQLKAKAYSRTQTIDSMKKDSLNWKLGFLNINTPYREFSPLVAINTLFFSSNKPLLVKKKAFGWDGSNFAHLWEIPLADVHTKPLSEVLDSIYKKPTTPKINRYAGIYECGDTKTSLSALSLFTNKPTMKGDTNTVNFLVKGLEKIKLNAGAVSMDKNKNLYFSANYPKGDNKGINRICLMQGLYTSAGVINIQKLPFGDSNSYSVMHPTVNFDGTLLIFSSDKANGIGGYDLYYSQRSDSSQPWDTLKIFGNNINTIGNEVFPTITSNGFLYFSSDGNPGLGGLDIYRIPVQDAIDGNGTVEHLSYPINSSSDDFGWTQKDSTGVNGFFTSDRLGCDDNLYSFAYSVNKLPRKSFVTGTVLDKETLKPINRATVFLYNKQEDSVYVAKSDGLGKFHFPILMTTDIIIKAADNKYLPDCLSANVIYEPQPKDTIQQTPRDLLLDKYKVGFVWKLSNIHYDFDKFFIRADAAPILDSLVTFLNEHLITVELGSHTDCRGSFKYNERLSQHRADAAVAYLIKHGIDAKRITAKGYGEYQLLNRCADGVPCSEEEHQANRRTEVKVTGYTIPQKNPENIDSNKFKDGTKIDKNLLPVGFFDECK